MREVTKPIQADLCDFPIFYLENYSTWYTASGENYIYIMELFYRENRRSNIKTATNTCTGNENEILKNF